MCLVRGPENRAGARWRTTRARGTAGSPRSQGRGVVRSTAQYSRPRTLRSTCVVLRRYCGYKYINFYYLRWWGARAARSERWFARCRGAVESDRARRRLGDGPVHGQRLLLRIHGLDCVPDGRPHVSKLRDAPRLRAHTLDRHGRLGRADVLAHEIYAMGRIDDARDVGHLILDVGEGRLAGTIKPEHEVDVDASRFAHALDGEARLVFCVLRRPLAL